MLININVSVTIEACTKYIIDKFCFENPVGFKPDTRCKI